MEEIGNRENCIEYCGRRDRKEPSRRVFADNEDHWGGRDTKVAGDIEKLKPETRKQSLAKENCRQTPVGGRGP